ncbi:SMP-30/gluconolactonase/LRE family protein [Microvirga pudoricolor]|uniref:SMP-30/gluconolactonase/LRE family protein n=1 Tax=Microvirga pudoricolor TaxID=2778729 RepID=UPI00194FB272|nr:SMP-30/gluconolactonase/LRE family protein [Microvirga pudoricolor]MBM6595318.1 SMP-30/gluconolactonase/LRE family protein [Microvirga pudoricolor]
MFQAPPIIHFEVFASLPDRFRRVDGSAPWLKVQKRNAPSDSFLEGPSFDRDGNLYVTDIPYGRIFKIAPDASVELVVEYDGEPNGLKFHRDGRAFIADHKNGILALDVTDGTLETICDRPKLERFRGVNDLFFASNGDLYFTDQGQSGLQDPSGRLYRLDRSGRLECVLDGIPSPNGVLLSPDEDSVLVSVTRANQVWRAPLLLDGGTSKVGAFLQLSGGFGPDGMAMDVDGNLAVSHPGLGSVWLFSPQGEPILRIASKTGKVVTNCAFGGPDRRWLYATEADTGLVLQAELDTPGLEMFGLS